MTLAEANRAQNRNLLRDASLDDLQDMAKYWSEKMKWAEDQHRRAQGELAEVLLAIQERKL